GGRGLFFRNLCRTNRGHPRRETSAANNAAGPFRARPIGERRRLSGTAPSRTKARGVTIRRVGGIPCVRGGDGTRSGKRADSRGSAGPRRTDGRRGQGGTARREGTRLAGRDLEAGARQSLPAKGS